MGQKRGPMTPERKAALAAKTKASEAAFKAALERMPDLPPDQMSEDGCINLIGAFWETIHHDLAHKNRATIEWLDEPGFVVWANISRQDPDQVRAFLLEKVAGNMAYCTCSHGMEMR